MTNDAVKKRNELAANYLPDHEPFSDRHFKAGFDAGYKIAVEEQPELHKMFRQALWEISEETYHGNCGVVLDIIEFYLKEIGR